MGDRIRAALRRRGLCRRYIGRVVASVFLPIISPARLGWRYAVISLLLGYALLLRPAVRLLLLKEGRLAARLFDMASFYPLAQFAVIATFLLGDRFVW